MTEEQIGKVEAALGLALPDFYRETMMNLPAPLGDVVPLCDDPELLIERNQFNRKNFLWPNHYFAIGGDGAGNDFYLNLSRDDRAVYFIDHHGNGENQSVETDFVTWGRELAEGWAVFEAEQRVLQQEHQQKRRWWQLPL